MSDAPEFRDLVGEDLPPDERARLERVHEMLIEAGPPPELPPELEEPPDGRGAVRELEPTGLPRRRVGAALALAAAIALIAFLGGYLVGYKHTSNSFESVRTVALRNSQAQAVVRFGARDANGNTPMLVKVEGLKKLPARDYYVLYMTKDGKPVVVCGSFNVRGPQSTTLRFPVAYDPSNFDGLELERWDHNDRKAVPVVSAQIS
ncbi:MAG: hypothetical protein E6G31_01075 [Actinobacteria bacterium]|jgi:hypothetical protein|nr:MAG: hypothetical protein E6G31_01075 [Actinomycetota bacterium]